MRVLLAVVMIFAGSFAHANSKVALVVGMRDYGSIQKLDNTHNDARGIASTLEHVGFEVTTLLDGSLEDFRGALKDFAFRSETADLALVYFAGHGVEVQGENFLIPVDAEVENNKDVQLQAVSLKEILGAVDTARKMRIVILDSCRDNPFGGTLALDLIGDQGQFASKTRSASNQFSMAGLDIEVSDDSRQSSTRTRSASRETSSLSLGGLETQTSDAPGESDARTRSTGQGGLAPPDPERGTLVAYAARDGEVALDGSGGNSPFALALMEQLSKPGLEISLMFRKVRDQVMLATNRQQEPYTYGSLSGTPFYLAGPSSDESLVANDDPRIAWSDLLPSQEEQLLALSEQGDTRSMVGLAYIRLNPVDSRYSPAEAVDFLTKAAEAGSAEAQFELAKLYETGLGVEQDVQRAIALFQKSARQDFPDALNDLGFMYFQGDLGLPRDEKKALKYFERAANERHPEAMFNYAALIDDGLIADRGPEEAAGYLYQSLRSGSKRVFELLRDRPTMFKPETRRALQVRLSENSFYTGAIDGDFGPGTQRGIRAAYGIES